MQIFLTSEIIVFVGILFSFNLFVPYTVPQYVISGLVMFVATEVVEGTLKCNLSASWSESEQTCGVGWITRDSDGTTLFHSRRAYFVVRSRMEAELLSFMWATESMLSLRQDNLIFESSLVLAREALLQPHLYPQLQTRVNNTLVNISGLQQWSLDHVSENANRVASEIASSVLRCRKYQSYVATNGPFWLHWLIQADINSR